MLVVQCSAQSARALDADRPHMARASEERARPVHGLAESRRYNCSIIRGTRLPPVCPARRGVFHDAPAPASPLARRNRSTAHPRKEDAACFRLIARERQRALQHVSGRQDTELVAQLPGASAAVEHGDDGVEVKPWGCFSNPRADSGRPVPPPKHPTFNCRIFMREHSNRLFRLNRLRLTRTVNVEPYEHRRAGRAAERDLRRTPQNGCRLWRQTRKTCAVVQSLTVDDLDRCAAHASAVEPRTGVDAPLFFIEGELRTRAGRVYTPAQRNRCHPPRRRGPRIFSRRWSCPGRICGALRSAGKRPCGAFREAISRPAAARKSRRETGGTQRSRPFRALVRTSRGSTVFREGAGHPSSISTTSRADFRRARFARAERIVEYVDTVGALVTSQGLGTRDWGFGIRDWRFARRVRCASRMLVLTLVAPIAPIAPIAPASLSRRRPS